MNNQRRKEIRKAIELLEEAKYIIETGSEEEQEAFDNLPESIQYSERGERMEEIYDTLDNASREIQDIIDNLEEAIE